jgi:polar amino acid transport system substrate-binding protein
MTTRRFLISSLLALLPSIGCAGLHLVTQDKPPFNYLETDTGKITGLSIDILRAAAAKAKVSIASIDLYPMIRSIDMARTRSDTCVFPLVRTAERENLFEWVGPFAQNIWVFYARDDFNGQISTLEDAKKFQIGSDPHSAKTTYLKSLGFNSMDLLGEDSLNARKLSVGRFDLWLVGLYDGKTFADEAKVTNIKPVFEVKDVDYFLACNKGVSAKEIAALNEAIKSLKKDGTIQRAMDSYRHQFFGRNVLKGALIK